MIQFEKQQNEGCNIIVDCGSLSCDDCEIIQSSVWRAALTWAKKEAISLDERGDISRAIINRELES